MITSNYFLKINVKYKTTQNEGSFNKYHFIKFMDFLGQEFRQYNNNDLSVLHDVCSLS